MPSERVQRVIDGYLDEIEVAVKDGRWNDVIELANTILELDDANDDAQTFLKLAVSKSGSQETLSVNESVRNNQPIQEVSIEHEKLNLSQKSRPVITGGNEYTRHILYRLLRADDQELIDIVARDLKSIEEIPNRGAFARAILGSGLDPATFTRLRFIHLLIPLRKQDMPEGSESPFDNKSLLDSLEHWYKDNQADSNFRTLAVGLDEVYTGWGAQPSDFFPVPKFDLSLMTRYVEESYNEFKNPTVPSKKRVEPVTEPTSDYWKTRQALAPLANQDSGANQSSDSPPQREELVLGTGAPDSLGGWLVFVGFGLVGGIVFGVLRVIVTIGNLVEGYGPGYLLVMELLVELLLLVGYSWVSYLFFNKKREFQKAYPILLATAVASYLGLLLVLAAEVGSLELVALETGGRVVSWAFWSTIWILYAVNSKQIKATFTQE